jgi:hypothetical protein
MFGRSVTFRSPKQVLSDPAATEPVRLVLEDPEPRRYRRLVLATAISAAFVVVAGLVVWGWGVRTQRENPGFWHIALVSMLFWLSVSQGMVALSAILRLCHASWRYPLNRMLDIASLFGLWVGALLPFLVVARQHIYDLGSSEYRNNVWRVAGPAFYDALAVGAAYVAGWLLLYLTSLPDLAALRDRAPAGSRQAAFYTRISGLWRFGDGQWSTLRLAEGTMIIGVLLSFVGSQTILGWDFQLAAARNWDSSIFAPLYTLGSLLGALAMTTLVMTVTAVILRPRQLIHAEHYDNIGRFMIGLGLVWFYFRWCDYLTAWYGHVPDEWLIQHNRVTAFPILAAVMVAGCFIAPVFGNMFGRIRRSAPGSCAIAVLVLIGLAVQRYLDTVPTFAPNYPLSALTPTPGGIAVFLGMAGMFVLTYLIAARYIPIVSQWALVKERTRTTEAPMGNGRVTIMLEDPPIWET